MSWEERYTLSEFASAVRSAAAIASASPASGDTEPPSQALLYRLYADDPYGGEKMAAVLGACNYLVRHRAAIEGSHAVFGAGSGVVNGFVVEALYRVFAQHPPAVASSTPVSVFLEILRQQAED